MSTVDENTKTQIVTLASRTRGMIIHLTSEYHIDHMRLEPTSAHTNPQSECKALQCVATRMLLADIERANADT